MSDLIPITHGWTTAPEPRKAEVLERNFRYLAQKLAEQEGVDLTAVYEQLTAQAAQIAALTPSPSEVADGDSELLAQETPPETDNIMFWLRTVDMTLNIRYISDMDETWVMVSDSTVDALATGLIEFPFTPEINDIHEQNGGEWTWDGERWVPRPRIVDHNDLESRDAEDAHPIAAITGLQEELDAAQNISIARRWMLT